MSPVRYPYARLPGGAAIHVHDYTSGPVGCFDCYAPLIAKQGDIVEWHFAHHPDAKSPCNGDNALHELTKVVIAQTHGEARAAGRPYRLCWLCPRCRTEQSFDCTRSWSRVVVEASEIDGVRSDLFFEGDKPFAIEVVVTHEMTRQTEERYASAGVPVFVMRPRWTNVGGLRHEVLIAETHGLVSERCRGCQTKREREKRLQALFNRLKAALRDEKKLEHPDAARILGNWPPSRDPRGNPIFAHARHRIREQAIRLLSCGFHQHRHKRWVFIRVLPEDAGTVFVGLAGTGIDPAWSRRAPSMELRLNVPVERVENFGELIDWYLRRNDVHVNDEWRHTARAVAEMQGDTYGSRRRKQHRARSWASPNR